MSTKETRRLVPLLLAASLGGLVAGQSTPPTPTEDAAKAANEKVRAAVETVLKELESPIPATPDYPTFFHRATDQLKALGPAVAPYIVGDVLSPTPGVFQIFAYSLGFVRAEESVPTLRKAIEAAERNEDDFADKRKPWLVYSLAVAGDPEAVDLAEEPGIRSSWNEIFDRWRLMEVAAVLTAPESVPRLLALVDTYSASPDRHPSLEYPIEALGRVGDASHVARLLPFLKHERWQVRRAAATALGNIADPGAADALLAALDDPKSRVAEAAALSLEQIRPGDKVRALLGRLETESNEVVRAALYRALATMGGEELIEVYRGYWSRGGGGGDRLAIVDALGRLGSRKGLNFLRDAVRDADVTVALRAMESIRVIGGAGAQETLLGLIQDPRDPVMQTAVEMMAAARERRAGPRVADRLLQDFLSAPVQDTRRLTAIAVMAEALVELRHAAPLDALREAIPRQPDPNVKSILEGLCLKLKLLVDAKDSVEAWSQASRSTDATVRKLAYSRLAELAGDEAVKNLASALDRVDDAEGVEVLRAIAARGSMAHASMIEEALLDPAWDRRGRAPQREMAAWAARRIGGDRLNLALKKAVERREGREIRTLLYYAVVAGKEALPALTRCRTPRMRHFEWKRGIETDWLDWALREIRAGRSLRPFDGVPDVEPVL